jgi:zinc resistance-associated protein
LGVALAKNGETIMTPFVRVSFAALVAAAALAAPAALAQTAAPATTPGESPQWMQRWIDDRAAMLDARLAGLKAGLRLTPDQEKLWGPFEAAVREFAESRMARMQGMMENAERDEQADAGAPRSPIERVDRMATRLSDIGAALRKIAEAGKPLYASLDDEQKRMFGFLSHEMMMMGRGHRGMGMMGPGMMGAHGHHHDWSDEGEGDE